MSIRHLDALLAPASIAVLGASLREGRIGATVWRNLSRGAYPGALYPVNPKYRELDGHAVIARVADLPAVPALALICTPPATVAGLVKQLALLGTRAAVVLTAGMNTRQKQALHSAAQGHGLRLLGPNSLGLLAPLLGLNASLAPTDARPGELAFVSQSGALVTTLLDWAHGRGIGFSQVVALGEPGDVDVADLLDYLARDPKTRAILLSVESIESPRTFMSAARAAARTKPVLVLKARRTAAGSDRVFDAALARAGLLRLDSLQELFLAAEILTRLRPPASDALTILSNDRAAAGMAADAAAAAGLTLAALSPATRLRLAALLPSSWSGGNPVELPGEALVAHWVQAVQALADDPSSGTVLLIHAPTARGPSSDLARALLPLTPPHLLGCWLGEPAAAETRRLFQEAGLAQFDTPEQAVQALALLQRCRLSPAAREPAPSAVWPDPGPDTTAIRRLVQEALASGRTLLTDAQAAAVLQACHIPVVPSQRVEASPAAAAAAARAIGFPVALKIVSDDISHKSEAGGIALDLQDETQVHAAAQTLLRRVQCQYPAARLQGLALQAMVRRAHAQELRVGSTLDPVFGPVILFGHGGTAGEILADQAVALPPLDRPLAHALVAQTRVSQLLAGWRGAPAVDEAALQDVLVAVSGLLAAIPEIVELDIDPLLVNFEGALALDARIRLSAAAPAGAAHFAIRPYPAELEETVAWQGRTLCVRPIRAGDEARHTEFLQQLEPEDIRMRVFYSRRRMARSELARLVQIDYAREMAFVALVPGADGQAQTLGVVRAMADPDNETAEFGVIVRSELKGLGLGRLLLQKLVAYQRSRGTQRLVATVLEGNERMLALARALGFQEDRTARDGEHTKLVYLLLT